MKKTNVLALTECAIMIALASVMSLIKLGDMPFGGSITLGSMLPVIIISYRHGIRWGIATSGVVSIIQLLLGLDYFAWVPKEFGAYLILILFDYVIAFAVYGLAGIFRKIEKRQNLALIYGAFSASLLRYICHIISGVTIWRDISIPGDAALIYSLGYNATYMIPDTIILTLVAGYIGSVIDFRAKIPTRTKALELPKLDITLAVSAGLLILGALIFDIVAIFLKLQADTGDFIISGLADVNWTAVGIVSAVCLAIAAALFTALGVRQRTRQA